MKNGYNQSYPSAYSRRKYKEWVNNLHLMINQKNFGTSEIKTSPYTPTPIPYSSKRVPNKKEVGNFFPLNQHPI